MPDDDVRPLPDREPALPRLVPERRQVRVVERPPGEIGDRERHRPHRHPADERPDDPDRPGEAEGERDRAEHERPGPLGSEAEQPVGQRGGRRRDHEQLEDGPAERLDDVDRRRQRRAAAAERGPHQHHRRDARLRTDGGGRREHRLADHAADPDRDQRVRERQRGHQRGAGDDHEQRDAEVPPEQAAVEEAEHAQPLRDGLDPPGRVLVAHAGSLRTSAALWPPSPRLGSTPFGSTRAGRGRRQRQRCRSRRAAVRAGRVRPEGQTLCSSRRST